MELAAAAAAALMRDARLLAAGTGFAVVLAAAARVPKGVGLGLFSSFSFSFVSFVSFDAESEGGFFTPRRLAAVGFLGGALDLAAGAATIADGSLAAGAAAATDGGLAAGAAATTAGGEELLLEGENATFSS